MLYPDAPFHLLTLQEEKLELLEHLGIQAVIILPFDLKISTMPPEAFIRRILIEKLRAKHLSVGFNYTFGLNKAGTPHLLEISGDKSGYTVEVLPPYLIDGVAVSSSLIRQLLREQGDVALAGEFLGRNYQVRGVVVHGDKRGRSIGFPTANLQVDSKSFYPWPVCMPLKPGWVRVSAMELPTWVIFLRSTEMKRFFPESKSICLISIEAFMVCPWRLFLLSG